MCQQKWLQQAERRNEKSFVKGCKKIKDNWQQSLSVFAEFTYSGNYTLLEVTNATARAVIKKGKNIP